MHGHLQIAGPLQIRLVREAAGRDLPADLGHRTVADWLRRALLLDFQPARDLADAATALPNRPALKKPLMDARLDRRQAATIAATVNALPETLSAADDPATL